MTLPIALPASSPERTDAFVFGENSLDVVVELDGPVIADGKMAARSVVRRVGGQAATVAVGIARQGLRVSYAGAIGDDDAASAIDKALRREGIDVDLVARPGVSSRSAVVLVDARTGLRTILESRDAALDLDVSEVPHAAAARCRVVSVDATDPRASLAIVRAGRRSGVPAVLDADRPGAAVAELIAAVDVVVVGAPFLRELTGRVGPGEGLAALAQDVRAPLLVATLGADGSLALCEGAEIRTPALRGATVDTTGAGDAFRAGFIAAWLRSGSDGTLEDLLRAANATAGLSCRALGAQAGLPTREAVEAALRTM